MAAAGARPYSPPMTLALFARTRARETLGEGAVVLRAFAEDVAEALVEDVRAIASVSPFRTMQTPGGRSMSASTTSAGQCGWVSDARGYRYADVDPATGRAWPPIPDDLRALAASAAAEAGFARFAPDACLVNRYVPGARMGLHQDRDERDFGEPIVSVSLGLPIVFLWGGATRAERPVRTTLEHGDVVVFGGASRLCFHGVAPLADGEHPLTGRARINLTLRRAR